MNYLKEINAFYDQLEINELSTSAIALWHALMHINNKAGWKDSFTVAVSSLTLKTGMADRTIYKARNELKQKGYIDFKSRKGNQSAVYQMVSLYAPYTDKYADSYADYLEPAPHTDNRADNHADNHADSRADNRAVLVKQKHKQNKNINNTAAAALPDTIMQHFCDSFDKMPTQAQQHFLEELLKRGMQEEVIIFAMTKAVDQNAHFGYAKKILTTWSKLNILTMQAVEHEQRNYELRKNGKKEVLPKWFENYKEEQEKQKLLGKQETQSEQEIDQELVEFFSKF